MYKTSVFGLGKVGLSLASCLASAGNKVVGVDLDQSQVDLLNQRLIDSAEPGVTERLQHLPQDAFSATTDFKQAVIDSEVSFVIVPTPSNTLGGFSLKYVSAACEEIGSALRHGRGRHTVAIVSTILPGSSDVTLIPRLEAASGRKIGAGLGFCYNPAFIALGDVVRGFEKPDYVLIGESDAESGDIVLDIHQSMVQPDTPTARMRPIEAEIAKIASNTHETMRVSFANMLFAACSEIPGADVDRITAALGHRMGHRFFKGAVPYGGPCWPRDNQALSTFLELIGTSSTMPRAVDQFNSEHARYVLRKVLEFTSVGEKVGILGLAYKPGTPYVVRSFAIELAKWLVKEGRTVLAWDPLANQQAEAELGDTTAFMDSAESCLRQSAVAVLINPLQEFNDVDWSAAHATTIVDCWRCLSEKEIPNIERYHGLGRGPATDFSTWFADKRSRFDLLSS